MVYLFIYGLLALGVMCIAIAPKTNSLWRIGLTFFLNWIATVLIAETVSGFLEPVLCFGVDLISAWICFITWEKYKCNTARYVMYIYTAQLLIYIYMLISENPYLSHVAQNALFILNALIIIWGATKSLTFKEQKKLCETSLKNSQGNNQNRDFWCEP